MEDIVSIRGAISVKANNASDISTATEMLITELFKQNKLAESQIINIFFTVTNDLDAVNPATVAREKFKLDSMPMLCVQEMNVKNSLPRCIRIMINAYSNITKDKVKHVYLGGAESLRPDWGVVS